MNRAERRRREKQFGKDIKSISKLNPQQAKIIDIAATEKAKTIANAKIEEFSYLIDRCTSAVLVEKDWNLVEIEEFQIRIAELLQQDIEKTHKLEKENLDMAKLEKEVKNYIEKLLDKGVPKKQAIDDLVFKFPKLSKSMLFNAYAKVKEEKEIKITREKIVESAKKHGLNKEGKNKIAKELKSTYSTIATYISRWKITAKDIGNIEEQKTEKAVNQIMDIIEEEPNEGKNKKEKLKEWDKKYNPNGKLAAEVKEIEKAEKVIKEVKEIQCKEELKVEGLKVLEEKIIKTVKVEGKNGIYIGKTGEGIILTKDNATISFENIEQLESFTEEYRQVFEMVK